MVEYKYKHPLPWELVQIIQLKQLEVTSNFPNPITTMMFKHTVCLLLLLAIQATAQSSSSSSDDKPTEDLSFSDQNQEQPQSEPSVEEPATEELDTSDPTLWQMAAFSARQMSTKSMKTKLSTLNSAERIASSNGFLYKLRVTFHRFSLQQPTGNSNVSQASSLFNLIVPL